MDDDEIQRLNTCLDLVSRKQFEAFPNALLTGRAPGEWTNLRVLCQQIGLKIAIKADLFATWLADPLENDAYAVILFFDAESNWTTAAHYNKQRLQDQLKTSEEKALSTVGGIP